MICSKCDREIGYAAKCPYCGTSTLKTPTPYQLPVGTPIGGRFRVTGVLSESDRVITYLAQNETLGSWFAVKEYYPSDISHRDPTGTNAVLVDAKDEGVYARGKDRFLSDARTLARFSGQPGIVSVTDCIEENGTVYLVTEYLRGETLAQHLKHSEKPSADEAFKLFEPVIKALEKCHEAGMIHRGISPDTIMMSESGYLKLTDLGAPLSSDDNPLSSEEYKKGYTPVELYRGERQGPWTDVYALCATIYRCITGKTPDDALDRTEEDTLQKPSSLGAEISPEKEKALLRGLAIRPQARCQSMSELLRLWKQADENASDKPTASRRRKNSPKKKSKKGVLIGLLAATLVIVIAGAVILFKPWPGESDDTKKKSSATEDNSLSYAWKVIDVVWNTDENDIETDMASVPKKKKVYLHFQMESDPAGGALLPIIKYTTPEGVRKRVVFSDEIKSNGWAWYCFDNNDPEGATGELEAIICDENGNELYTDSIEITRPPED